MARLLTFNSQEHYVWLLSQLGFDLDIVTDLPGRTLRWDHQLRPVPAGARLLDRRDVSGPYVAAIAHTLTDLDALATLQLPVVLVLHDTVIATSDVPDAARRALVSRVAQRGAHVVAVSEAKADSWAIACDVIPPGLDHGWFGEWSGKVAAGLWLAGCGRIPDTAWPLRRDEDDGIPKRIVGQDSAQRGAMPSSDWTELRALMTSHRFFIHMHDDRRDDAWDLASIEAMLSGMPIVCAGGRDCPVQHGVSGIVSGDAGVLRQGMRQLLADQDLARAMGVEARKAAMRRFPRALFIFRWHRAIESAIQKHANLLAAQVPG